MAKDLQADINRVLDTLDLELGSNLQQFMYKDMNLVKEKASAALIKIIRGLHKIDDEEFKENYKIEVNMDESGLDIKSMNLYSTILLMGRYKPYSEVSYLDRFQFEDGLVIGYNEVGMFVIAPNIEMK